MTEGRTAVIEWKKSTIGMSFFLVAVAIHSRYFPWVVPRDDRALSGRNLFQYETYTAADFGHQLWIQLTYLFLIQGLPMLLLWAAYRAVRRERESGRFQISAEYFALFFLAAFLLPVGYGLASQEMPLSGDEFSYVFQSRVFRMGRLSLVGGGFLDFLLYPDMLTTVPWCQLLPPGLAGFLTLFPDSLVWLGPPVLCALSLLALYLLGRELVGPDSSRWGVALVALSPGFFWSGGLYFPHHALLSALAGGSFLYIRANAKDSPLLALPAGILLSWGFCTRPAETGLFGLVAVLWFIIYRKQVALRGVPFAALCVTGLLGSSFCLAYSRHVGGFYSFLDLEPRQHLVAGLWNAFYIVARQVGWWSPFILTLACYRVKRGALTKGEVFLLLNALFGYLAFAGFIDNGQLEFGSRYLLPSWAFLGILAGAQLDRLGSKLPNALANALLIGLAVYNLAVMPTLYAETRGVFKWLAYSLRHDYPPNSDFYIRSTPDLKTAWFGMTLPGDGQPHFYSFLEPERTYAFRRRHPNRPSYVVDWRGDHYTVVPFEETNVLDSYSRMSAANQIARGMQERDRGIREWRKIRPEDPFYAAARMSIAMVYLETGDRENGIKAFREVEALGVPEERLRPIREKYQIPSQVDQ